MPLQLSEFRSAIIIRHIGTVPLQFYSSSKYTITYLFNVFLKIFGSKCPWSSSSSHPLSPSSLSPWRPALHGSRQAKRSQARRSALHGSRQEKPDAMERERKERGDERKKKTRGILVQIFLERVSSGVFRRVVEL
jgi:hypothetical protein